MKALATLAAALGLLVASPAASATQFTGDRIDGVAVIEKLDVADLPAGQISRFYFRVVDQSVGQGWYVPVMVAKGAKPGKKLLLTAGIHGDEYNGIDVIHRLFAGLDPATLSGTVVAVPGLNQPGLLNATRNYSGSVYASPLNLNRQMPGDVHSDEVAEVYAARLWNQIFIGNADQAIDLHTQSRGTLYPIYAFAETAEARRMADMIRPDMIKMDAGVKGTVENMLNAAGVPSVTLELAGPERFDPVAIGRGMTGVRNVMIDMGILPGKPVLEGPDPFVGNLSQDVSAPRGGYAHILVKLGDPITKGQVLATIADPFGRTVATVTAPIGGRALSIGTSPAREIGALLVRILAWSDAEPCKPTSCH